VRLAVTPGCVGYFGRVGEGVVDKDLPVLEISDEDGPCGAGAVHAKDFGDCFILSKYFRLTIDTNR